MKLIAVVSFYLSIVLTESVQFSGCLNSGRAFYRYWAEQKEKVICYFHQYPVKDVSLNVSSENALKYITNKYKQSNITEAITPTLEDLRNFHYAALLEYPEYAKGIAGALFGLFFVRYDDFITDDLSGMYNGKMIWYDGTPVKTDFSSFYDPPFDPRINKSNCYRFMTWTSKDNDFKIVPFECNQTVVMYYYLIGFSYLIDLPKKIIGHKYNWDSKIKLAMDGDLSYPKKCALGDHGWQGADGEVHCFSIAYKLSNYTEELYSIDDSLCDIQRKRRHISMYPATFRNKDEYQFIVEKLRDDLNTDQPIFYQYHTVLFGLWYFRGVGYRWNDFSQNSDFGFIDPNFSPQRNISQCYRFLAIPFGGKYAVPMECSRNINILSVLCMYKSDQFLQESQLPRITISEEDEYNVQLVDLKLLAKPTSKVAGD